MRVYWFQNSCAEHGAVVVAENEDIAWHRLVASRLFDPDTRVELTRENVRNEYKLLGSTALGGKTDGVIAVVHAGPGGGFSVDVLDNPGDDLPIYVS